MFVHADCNASSSAISGTPLASDARSWASHVRDTTRRGNSSTKASLFEKSTSLRPPRMPISAPRCPLIPLLSPPSTPPRNRSLIQQWLVNDFPASPAMMPSCLVSQMASPAWPMQIVPWTISSTIPPLTLRGSISIPPTTTTQGRAIHVAFLQTFPALSVSSTEIPSYRLPKRTLGSAMRQT